MPTAKTKPTIVHMEGRIMWKIGRSKEGNWIAICDALKLTLQAETTAFSSTLMKRLTPYGSATSIH
jgi:hypothetical protein